MADLELRRAAYLADGWIPCDCRPGCEILLNLDMPDGAASELPAVESDPGVSEPWFIDWCDKNGWDWELKRAPHRKGYCVILYAEDGKGKVSDGATPSEARARTVVAAVKAKAANAPENLGKDKRSRFLGRKPLGIRY